MRLAPLACLLAACTPAVAPPAAGDPTATTGGTYGTPDWPPSASGATPSAPSPSAAALATAHQQANQATESFLLGYFRQGGTLAADSSTATEGQYWNRAEAYESVLDAVERNGGHRFAGWPATLYAAEKARGFSRDYYDDENWMTMALLRSYVLDGDANMLADAKTLYADIEAAWDTTCCGAEPGGLWWDRAHTQKATAANAGAVLSGVRLYEMTKDQQYLDFAEQVYAYWQKHMVASTGQVYDHLDTDGKVVAWKFTYNEGLFIGASVALASATGNSSYLDDATPTVAFMLSHETTSAASGPVLFDGSSASCGGDCQQFKGIGARFLGAFEAATGDASVLALLSSSASSLWSVARGSNGLYATDWTEAPSGAITLASDGSAVAGLNAFAAALGAAPSTTWPAAGSYEAEEAELAGVGLEASHTGFGGWGYVAGWNADGQAVTFTVDVASAGSYHASFRYSAGAGAATRALSLGGKLVVAKQSFPSTTSWDQWSTATLPLTLPAGKSRLTVAFSSADGSASYLNLDALTLGP